MRKIIKKAKILQSFILIFKELQASIKIWRLLANIDVNVALIVFCLVLKEPFEDGSIICRKR